MKIAFLIPCKGETSWKKVEDSLLFKKTLSSFIPEKGHKYFFYIGYDHDDIFYTGKKKYFTKKVSEF